MNRLDRGRKNKGMITTFIVGGVGVVLIEYYIRPMVQSKTGAKGR